MKVERFSEFESKKNKEKKLDQLSDDITAFKKVEDKYEKITEPIEIVQITGIITDPKEIEKLEENMVPVNLGKESKVGDVIWITAIINYSKSPSINSQNFCVLEVRIINVYKGLNAINRIK